MSSNARLVTSSFDVRYRTVSMRLGTSTSKQARGVALEAVSGVALGPRSNGVSAPRLAL